MGKINLNSYLTPYTKINSKWTVRVNIEVKLKFVEENRRSL